ncbi:MAG TPA: hypothetical protein VFU76_11415 [Terriglobales bacterium]|nr:hypothetical protein [Terriglobales bacterium]
MLRAFSKALVWLAVGAVFFALVCPLAPTPTALGKVKRPTDSVVLVAPLLPLTPLLARTLQFREMFRADSRAVPGDLTSLICVRTC